MIRNEPCTCALGECRKLVEPPAECINRYTGNVVMDLCVKCGAFVWHQNGECIRCRSKRCGDTVRAAE